MADELEKIARGLNAVRVGRRPFSVSNFLNKASAMEKYTKSASAAAAGAPVHFADKVDPGAAKLPKDMSDVPSIDSAGPVPRREDRRDYAATVHGPSVQLHDIASVNRPTERSY